MVEQQQFDFRRQRALPDQGLDGFALAMEILQVADVHLLDDVIDAGIQVVALEKERGGDGGEHEAGRDADSGQ